MREILKNGEISLLLPNGEGGGLSGEVHLLIYKNKKFVIRRCKTMKKAKYYEYLSKTFEKNNFLPPFLGRFGKDVVYEFLEGRDLGNDEKLKIFEGLGMISGSINNIVSDENVDLSFNKNVRELASGNFSSSEKVVVRRKRSKIRKKAKKVFNKADSSKIKKLYLRLKKIVNPIVSLDAVDITPGNFRLSNGRIYLVDIESIKPSIQGNGTSKFLRHWGNTNQRKKAFIRGYNKLNNFNLCNQEYNDLINLRFAIQALWFKTQVARKLDEDLKIVNNLLLKYK